MGIFHYGPPSVLSRLIEALRNRTNHVIHTLVLYSVSTGALATYVPGALQLNGSH